MEKIWLPILDLLYVALPGMLCKTVVLNILDLTVHAMEILSAVFKSLSIATFYHSLPGIWTTFDRSWTFFRKLF